MSAVPDYTSWAISQYLANQADAEKQAERLEHQVEVELQSRETWEMGLAESSIEQPGKPNPIIDALIAGDELEAGRLIHKYITERFAVNQAEIAILRQIEDAANDFLVD